MNSSIDNLVSTCMKILWECAEKWGVSNCEMSELVNKYELASLIESNLDNTDELIELIEEHIYNMNNELLGMNRLNTEKLTRYTDNVRLSCLRVSLAEQLGLIGTLDEEQVYNEKLLDIIKGKYDRLAENTKVLDKIAEYKYNWNGYGAEPLNIQLLRRIKSIILTLEHQPKIFPTDNGSIQLEYEVNDNYLELEFCENGDIKLYKILGSISYRVNKISENEVNQYVNRFMQEVNNL